MPGNELFIQHKKNPILTTRDMHVDLTGVFNPGVAQVDGKVMLLRGEDREGLSHLVPAYSSDGGPALWPAELRSPVLPASWPTLSVARQLRWPRSRVLTADLPCSA